MRLAVWQTCPASDTADALARLDASAESAKRAGATLLVTPEMMLSGYNIGPDRVAAAAGETAAPPWSSAAEIARRHRIALCVGGPLRQGTTILNAALLFDPDGRPLAHYAKTHLFGEVDRRQFSAGGALSGVVALDGLRLALAICYDIEFPETARNLALAGAEVILVPTANMEPFDSVCTRLVPARAEENGTVIAYANYVGREGDFTYCGRSCISDATGEDLARAPAAEEVLLLADIDPAAIAAARARTPYLADRRHDLY